MDVDGTMEVHLQEEIIMDILSRLPVLSLLRFKCISKYWMTLISEPYFTLKHLNHAKNNQNSQKILVLHGEFPLHCSSLSSASLSSVRLAENVRKLDWPSNPRPWRFRMYCCYDGLALNKLCDYPQYARAILLLWNPSTRESIVLPCTEFSLSKDFSCGLGYDSTSDDYKIFKIDDTAHCEILALKSGSGRKIDKRPAGVFPVLSDTEDSLAFVHGAFHWLDSSLEKMLISFSISNEVYGEIPLPEGMSLVFNMNRINGVSALEGMLSVYSTHIRRGIHTLKLWILKDCDVKESWNRFFTIQGTDLYSIPKYKFSDGEVLLRCRDLECGSVFKASKESSRLWPQSVSEPIQAGFVYTERKRVMKHSEINKMDVDGTMEILSRLPHLNRVKNDQNSQRFLVSQWSSLYCSSLSSVQRVEEVQKLDRPSNAELWRCFLYCCYDSLALIGVYNYRDHTHQLWLWNPSTRESIVPGPKFPPELFCTWGLGYDSVSDDYKILKIDMKSCSEILTLNSGSWRLTNKYPTDILPALFCTDSLVFVRGAFHWIDDITRFTVTALSISSEVYTEIPLPEQMLSIYNQTRGVSVLTEKLCAYAHYTSQTFRFWVMEDYGVKDSWTELFHIQVAGFLLVIQKYRFSDGELLLCCRDMAFRPVFRTSKGPLGLCPQSNSSQKDFVQN
ncbi:hypothetical protein CQW23_29442 [Capsicum baccatum]|uniref:F-box domain-containing protein n=1 Tax=Capsicum baccatum TaxID=33114 RepID=A0A2G2VJE6_CAPBA|nr:hypothetical protein CQW23_29442 [Capsicum baccatum]